MVEQGLSFEGRCLSVPVVDDDIHQPVFKEMPPGPGLALLLGAQEYDWLDDFDIIEMARSARRLASWAASMEYGAVAELSARRKTQGERLGAWDSEIGEWVTDEIAAALTLSGNTAAREVVIAEQLTETLPRHLPGTDQRPHRRRQSEGDRKRSMRPDHRPRPPG
jgi:hypothetical protein